MKLNQTHEFPICSIIRLEIRWRYNHMSNKVLKPKKASLYQFTKKYSNNIDNCIEFFKSMKWPEGFSCDRCGCHKYYLVKRIGKTKIHMFLNAAHAISNIHCFQALFFRVARLIYTSFC